MVGRLLMQTFAFWNKYARLCTRRSYFCNLEWQPWKDQCIELTIKKNQTQETHTACKVLLNGWTTTFTKKYTNISTELPSNSRPTWTRASPQMVTSFCNQLCNIRQLHTGPLLFWWMFILHHHLFPKRPQRAGLKAVVYLDPSVRPIKRDITQIGNWKALLVKNPYLFDHNYRAINKKTGGWTMESLWCNCTLIACVHFVDVTFIKWAWIPCPGLWQHAMSESSSIVGRISNQARKRNDGKGVIIYFEKYFVELSLFPTSCSRQYTSSFIFFEQNNVWVTEWTFYIMDVPRQKNQCR